MDNKGINQPLNITIVEPRGSGGMIHYAYQLCTALANAGCNVTLITTNDYELGNYPHNFTVNKLLNLWPLNNPSESGAGNKIYRNTRRIFRGIRYITEWIRLTFHLLSSKSDIIQFGKIEFPFEAIFLTILKSNGMKLSQICHEFELREQGTNPIVNFTNQLFRWVYQSFSLLFFHSENNKERFLSLFNVDSKRLKLIPHGNENMFLATNNIPFTELEIRSRYNINSTATVVLFFGNLMPSKGIPDLLKAFSLVRASTSQVQLIVAGKPTKHINLDELVKLANDLGIGESTIFDSRYIPIEEVAPLMKMASVVVYPYLNSTQSGSLQVAYAFGRPVIATNVGGLPDAVEDGKSGFLVPASDPPAIANALMKFINDPNLSNEMGIYAKHLSETRFSWNTVANKLLTAYKELLAD